MSIKDADMGDDKAREIEFRLTEEISALEEENQLLRQSVTQLRTEIDRYRSPALLVAELIDLIQKDGRRMAIIRVPNGNKFLVEVSSDAENLRPGISIVVEQKNLTVIEEINEGANFNVEQYVIINKPEVKWTDIGGLADQVREIQEVIELPLEKPELFKKVGITPPKGILLHGPPGTGKTLMAKAVANSTGSTFIEVVGSELVQKFIGEGAKLVKEIFDLARSKAPAIVFIDEIDSLAAKRIELGTSGEREVQRTFMQLLAEIDGFNNLGNVKIIGATNRKDILDPAIIRPGRLDRLIEVPAPDIDGLKQIFKIHTKNMKISKKTNIDKVLRFMKGFTGAEVKATVTEAGYFAIREDRTTVKEEDLLSGIEKVNREEKLEGHDYMNMFG